MDNYVRAGSRMTRVSIHIGDTGTARAWGVDVRSARAVEHARFAVDLSGSLWRQPRLDASSATAALETGALAAATVQVALGGSRHASPVGLVGEFGYKTDGFVQGERLHSGPLVRLGLTIALDRNR